MAPSTRRTSTPRRPARSEPSGHAADDRPQATRCRALLLASPQLLEALEAVRRGGPPDAAIAGGAVRDAVWDGLHGNPLRPPRDVDVIYHDPADLDRRAEAAWEARLGRLVPAARWEVRNQAAVHRWYPERFGVEAAPLRSLEEAVATWPEICTCVAVRLDTDGELEVIAPLGLDDLLGMVVRHNTRRATAAHYRGRLGKFDRARWPQLRIQAPAGGAGQ